MFHLVNPSDAPKKGKRRNPELLIVNPYKLGDKKRRKNMAKRKRKSRRKNPLARRGRRRNPAVMDTVKDMLDKQSLKEVALGVLGGGAALTLGSALAGERLGESNVAKAVVALASGVGGAVILSQLGQRMGQPMLSQAAAPVAAGAMVLGLWELARGPVEDAVAKARSAVGLAEWQNEFEGWVDETTGQIHSMSGGASAAGFGGLGQPVTVQGAEDEVGQLSGSSYERLGDIYNGQRLGSFESEFGGFEAETPLGLLSQQETDLAAAKQGLKDPMKAIGAPASAGFGQWQAGLYNDLFEVA